MPREPVRISIVPEIEENFLRQFSNAYRPDDRMLFPAFRYVGPNGQEQTFSVGRGELVLLNIWATWCPPCLIELPDLEKLSALLPDDISVRVLAVSVDQGADYAGLGDFLRARGLWAQAANHDTQGTIMRHAPVRGLPSSFLLAEGGEILYVFEGAAPWAGPASLSFFNALRVGSPRALR